MLPSQEVTLLAGLAHGLHSGMAEALQLSLPASLCWDSSGTGHAFPRLVLALPTDSHEFWRPLQVSFWGCMWQMKLGLCPLQDCH